MPSWTEVLEEITQANQLSPLDVVRRKYLDELFHQTGRNVICYYSGWLQKPNTPASIDDNDKNGLMTTIHGLDHSIGLDLILHTPGGNVAATESIVHYLRTIFNDDIRVFIPQIAMSAGTMIACAAKEIYMGKESNIGPIDPQFNGIPAHGVIEEFENAIAEVSSNPSTLPIWQTVIGKYHPTFIGECKHAIALSDELVTKWLTEVMFKDEDDAAAKASVILSKLNNHLDTKTHSRHIHYQEAIDMGLKVKMLEDDQDLQDLVLTVHHAYMHTLANTNCVKIIENHANKAMIQTV